jgi:hypothetical protein
MELAEDSRRRISVTLAFVAVALCAVMGSVEAQGEIRVFNLCGDPVIMSNCRDFVGRSLPAGSTTIGPMKETEWGFRGYRTVHRAWTCRFQWTDSSDCGGQSAGPCKVHTKDVSLWSPACVDCVWRTHVEGFYQRDGRVQPADWHFMFAWD